MTEQLDMFLVLEAAAGQQGKPVVTNGGGTALGTCHRCWRDRRAVNQQGVCGKYLDER